MPLSVYARDGKLIALFGETRRYPVKIENVPPRVKQAFIAIEDARFYEHHGVDFSGIGARRLAAGHHRRQARAGRQHDHPAGGARTSS